MRCEKGGSKNKNGVWVCGKVSFFHTRHYMQVEHLKIAFAGGWERDRRHYTPEFGVVRKKKKKRLKGGDLLCRFFFFLNGRMGRLT